MVIEQVTGKHSGLGSAASGSSGRLGLDDTFVQGFEAPPTGIARAATCSGRRTCRAGRRHRLSADLSAATVAWGAGDIVSTAADLADWARAVYGGELL